MLASCSQLIGLHDDLDVADGGAADGLPGDETSGEASVDAAGEGGIDVALDAPPDIVVSDGPGADATIPPCTSNPTDVCVVASLGVVPIAFAATSLSLYYADGTTAGIKRVDSSGTALQYSASSGQNISSIAALGTTIAYAAVGPNAQNQIVTVTQMDGTGSVSTAGLSPAPASVALTSAFVGWVGGANSLSAAASSPSGVQNALPLSSALSIHGGGATFALQSIGPNYTVRTCGGDGAGGNVHTFPSGGSVSVFVDASGNTLATYANAGTTQIDKLVGGVITTATTIPGTARGLAVSSADYFVALDPATDAGSASLRTITRVNRTTPTVVSKVRTTFAQVGLIAVDNVNVYWIETTGSSSVILRAAL